ncbi:electron transporter RnfE [Aliifodinibius salipaludis]|uniref:Electron transporter RnfE n=1 Tax=Fodinibius salipaludis TaxID=2032627 RepID=A0A2A2GBJ7_9BACT|nr:electron transporter RnfE [Aliifodinibius salipaludis]
MHDFNFSGGGWMMFFWLFIIIVLVLFVMQALKNSGQNNQNKETPMEILKRRYANGEIDEEEFNKRKKELLK